MKVKWKLLSRVQLFTTPWTIHCMEFSRPEYYSGYSLSLLQQIFPAQKLNRGSPALQVDSLPTELSGKPLAVAIYFLLIDVIKSHRSKLCLWNIIIPLFSNNNKKSTLSNTLNNLKETLSSPVSGCRFKSAFWKCFSVQFSSVAQSCPTLCDPMDCTITNSRNLLKLMSIELVGSPCCSRDSQESSPTPQFKSNNSLMLNFLYSSTHIHTWLLDKPYLWLDGSLLAKLCLCFLICCLGLS